MGVCECICISGIEMDRPAAWWESELDGSEDVGLLLFMMIF
jgi:hypothetical protein